MRRNSLLAVFLFSVLIVNSVNADTTCAFQPNSYNTLQNTELAMTLNVTGNLSGGLITGECVYIHDGHDETVGQFTIDGINQLEGESKLYSGSCIFRDRSSSTRQNIAGATLRFGDASTDCGIASVWVTYLMMGPFVASAIIENGSIADIGVNVTNLLDGDANDIFLRLDDATSQTQIGATQKIDLNRRESRIIIFKLNTPQFDIGSHELVANATKSTHSAVNQTAITIIQRLNITEVHNTTTTSSAAIFFSTNTPSNLTINYWNSGQQVKNASNSTYVQQHALTLGNLTNNTQYFYKIAACNQIRCVDSQEFSFMTLQGPTGATASPTASVSPSPSASASPSVAASTAPTPPPTGNEPASQASPTPPPISAATIIPSPTPSPSPTLQGFRIDTDVSDEEVRQQFEAKLTPEDLGELLKAPDKSLYNRILVIEPTKFDPAGRLREGAYVQFVVRTDSVFPLINVSCYLQNDEKNTLRGRNAAACECTLNYSNNPSNFICKIIPKFPKVLGEHYTLKMVNTQDQKGLYTINLLTGQAASITRQEVKSTRNSLYFYGGIFVAVMLVVYGIYHILQKFEREGKEGDMLMMQKKKVIEDMEMLKFHYLKRDIDYDTFTLAMTQKQKEITEINTRMAELQNKIAGKKRISARPQEPPKQLGTS
ncbi:MAG: fibronectin type III domain-containing protein [Candidatus Micrarchaeota archaeon]